MDGGQLLFSSRVAAASVLRNSLRSSLLLSVLLFRLLFLLLYILRFPLHFWFPSGCDKPRPSFPPLFPFLSPPPLPFSFCAAATLIPFGSLGVSFFSLSRASGGSAVAEHSECNRLGDDGSSYDERRERSRRPSARQLGTTGASSEDVGHLSPFASLLFASPPCGRMWCLSFYALLPSVFLSPPTLSLSLCLSLFLPLPLCQPIPLPPPLSLSSIPMLRDQLMLPGASFSPTLSRSSLLCLFNSFCVRVCITVRVTALYFSLLLPFFPSFSPFPLLFPPRTPASLSCSPPPSPLLFTLSPRFQHLRSQLSASARMRYALIIEGLFFLPPSPPFSLSVMSLCRDHTQH